jgi:hypothetical protein
MGATTFEEFVKASDTICSANAAFRKAVEDAIFEHGHGSYSGTIKEKHSFRIVGESLSIEDAERMSQSLLDTDFHDKWGPAGCIEIKRGKPVGKAFTVRKKVEAYSEIEARRLFTKEIGSNEEIIEGPEVVFKKKGKITHKVQNNEDKTVLRYVVTLVGKNYVFRSKSEAIKFIKGINEKVLSKNLMFSPNTQCSIEQKKVSEKNDSSVVARVSSKKEPDIYDVSAKVKKVDFSNAKTVGWFFFGWASC